MVQHSAIDHTGVPGVSSGSVATDPIFDAKGDLPAGTGANTAAKLTVGADGLFLQANSAQSTGLQYALPGLLAVTRYAPTSQTVYTSSSTTLADVDATNLSVAFTAPLSGNVLVRLTAYADISAGTGDGHWGLRESTSDLAFSVARVVRNQANAVIASVAIYLTGVSAGSHTYKWSFAASSGTSTRIIIQDGTAVGEWAPGIMEVWAAP